jgi:hypothetical protein
VESPKKIILKSIEILYPVQSYIDAKANSLVELMDTIYWERVFKIHQTVFGSQML